MAETGFSSYRVLLVDDEPFIRKMTGRVLGELGCNQLAEAGNGREALALLDGAGANVDLILCDLAMPDMDGVEIVRHLASRPASPALAFLSGTESGVLRAAEALARAYGLRILGCLSKPATKDALTAVLQQVSEEQPARTRRRTFEITEHDLARGIQADELCLFYQPKVSLEGNRLHSLEALVRWNHPEHGLVFPDAFIPLAESTPLLGPMTEKLVEIAMRQLAAWKQAGLSTHVGVNLSPSMLSDVTLPDRFAAMAADFGLDPESIVLEITETGVAKEETIYLEIVTRLHLKGFALSIDDFGTGQSSLQKLEALPFHELKVDRQFVHGASRNPAKRAILQASLGLARSLGLKTVAEGVELPEDWELLKALGCEIAQGYYVSKPMPHADVLGWATRWQARPSA